MTLLLCVYPIIKTPVEHITAKLSSLKKSNKPQQQIITDLTNHSRWPWWKFC